MVPVGQLFARNIIRGLAGVRKFPTINLLIFTYSIMPSLGRMYRNRRTNAKIQASTVFIMPMDDIKPLIS